MTMTLLLSIIIVLLIIALIVVWCSRENARAQADEQLPAKEKKGKGPEKLPGVRREAAMQREAPKVTRNIFTREVRAGRRRFYFDLGMGSQERVLKISEMETEGRKETAYTLIVYEREIQGFYRALTDTMAKLRE
jgi:hypothetical protein